LTKSSSISAFFQKCFGLLDTFPFFNNNVGIAVARQNVEQTTTLFLGNFHLEQALQDLYCMIAPTNIRIRQESYACLLFKSSKYLLDEVMNFYIDNLNTLCGHTTALHANFPTSYTFDVWALFEIIPLNAKEYPLIDFTNLVSDHEAMEAIYGESYGCSFLKFIHGTNPFLKPLVKFLSITKPTTLRQNFYFFL